MALEELNGLKAVGMSESDILLGISALDQLSISYCSRREDLPDLKAVCFFGRTIECGVDENRVSAVIDAIRTNHAAYLDAAGVDEAVVKESVDWANCLAVAGLPAFPEP